MKIPADRIIGKVFSGGGDCPKSLGIIKKDISGLCSFFPVCCCPGGSAGQNALGAGFRFWINPGELQDFLPGRSMIDIFRDDL